jgi:hypothetical protein
LFQHVQASKQGPGGATASVPPKEGEAQSGDLAAFARSIGPMKFPQP